VLGQGAVSWKIALVVRAQAKPSHGRAILLDADA